MASTAVIEPQADQAQFVAELQELRRAPGRRAADHPFVHAMLRGEASEDQVKVQCVQQYFHTVAFVDGLTRLASRCKIAEIQREIAAGVYEEYTGKLSNTGPHLELFFRYAESWGFTRDQLQRTGYYLVPEGMALINWYMYAADHLSPLEGIAVFTVGAEGVNVTFPGLPGLSRQVCDALLRHYHKTQDDVFFWDLHDKVDQGHSTTGLEILARHATTEDQRDRIRAAVRMTTDVWYHFVGAPLNWTMDDVQSVNSSFFY